MREKEREREILRGRPLRDREKCPIGDPECECIGALMEQNPRRERESACRRDRSLYSCTGVEAGTAAKCSPWRSGNGGGCRTGRQSGARGPSRTANQRRPYRPEDVATSTSIGAKCHPRARSSPAHFRPPEYSQVHFHGARPRFSSSFTSQLPTLSFACFSRIITFFQFDYYCLLV